MERIAEAFKPIPSTVKGILEGFEAAGCQYSGGVWSEEFLDIEVFSSPEVKAHIGRVFPTELSDTGLRSFIIESDRWNRKTWRNHFIRYFRDTVNPIILAFVPRGNDLDDALNTFSLTIMLSHGPCDVPSLSHSNPTFRAARVWTAVVTASISEELSEFEATVAAASHKMRVTDILSAVQSRDNDSAFDAFDSLGLKCISEGTYEARRGSPLRDAVLFVDVAKSSRNVTASTLRNASNKYYEKNADRPDWVIALTSDAVTYYTDPNDIVVRFKLRKSDTEGSSEILNALVAVVDRHSSFNAETFAHQFGKFSPLYATSISALNRFFTEKKEKVEVAFREWKRLFERVYRKGDTDIELFIRHSYLSLLIRITLMVKYLPADLVKNQALDEVISFFESRGVSLFIDDFFHWATTITSARAHLFLALRDATFDADDIFRTIYQQMVSPDTRKALGEFYTPPQLASMMVDDSYEFGQTVLDPACGSGTFLVEVITRILNSSRLRKKKEAALMKIYGFDVNPIAVSVSKANLLLLLTDFYDQTRDLPIQVFLCDSLYPVVWETQHSMELGETIVFDMHSIDKQFVFSSIFFDKENRASFIRALTRIDFLISDSDDIDVLKEEVVKLLKEPDFSWAWDNVGYMEEDIELPAPVGNLVDFTVTIAELGRNYKNHIWIFLLFNALGAEELKNVVDLCIGNPPWLVINGIYSAAHKQRMKKMAESLGIFPRPHNVSNLEISALFLYRCRDMYLKNQGTVFFVVSNAFASGSNHDGTRNFRFLDEIEIWKFDEDLFNIHSICLKAKKNTSLKREPKDITVLTHFFQPTNESSTALLAKRSSEVLVPYEIEVVGNRTFVKKLISKSEMKQLLPRGDNPYRERIRRGAEINPQNLLFVHVKKELVRNLIIEPRTPIYAKAPWTFTPFERATIESDYVYKVIGSLELVPFVALRSTSTFLPLNPTTWTLDIIGERAKKHFMLLEQQYKKHAKEGTYTQSLREVVDYRNKLTASDQMATIKIVVNVSGTQVKSAIVRGGAIISSTLYYFTTRNLAEAMYFATLIQAPAITRDVQLRQAEGAGGHGRHIHTRAYEYPFPMFDNNISLHKEIVRLGEKMRGMAYDVASEFISLAPLGKPPLSYTGDEPKIPVRRIRNVIYSSLSEQFIELDELVLQLLGVGTQ